MGGSYLTKPITTKKSSDGDGFNFMFGVSSMQGWRKTQEDAHNCCINFDENTSLFAVYDGHCGEEVAIYCSQNLPKCLQKNKVYKQADVIKSMSDTFLEFDQSLIQPEIINNLKNLSSINYDIVEDPKDVNFIEMKRIPGTDSGCTAIVAILENKNLYVANIGDSRCVLCRNDNPYELSFDHKPTNLEEKQRIENAGGNVTFSGRINGGLNVSRSFGDHRYKKNIKQCYKDQMITAYPDVKHVVIDAKTDKFIILACDGIWNSKSSAEVIAFVNNRINNPEKKISEICEELFDDCISPDGQGNGIGCDNMTAIIIKFISE